MAYRYLRDPLFLFCVLLYCLNRCVLKPAFPGSFFGSYLNDLICIPFWVPIMLFAMRRFGLRGDDAPPRSHEVLVPLLVWSMVFELAVPRLAVFHGLAVSDHVDIFFYTLKL